MHYAYGRKQAPVFSATLIDRYSRKRRPVDVVVEPHRLRLFSEEGEPLDDWAVKGLQFAEKVERGQPVCLAHATHHRVRLIVDDLAILAELRRAGIKLRVAKAAWGGMPTWMIATVVVVVVLAVGLLSGSTLVTNALVRLIPARWEKSWGNEIVDTVSQSAPFCKEPEGQDALQTLVKRLAATTEASFPFQVHVSNAPVANAFAVPGGQVVIFRGLLDVATTPEEVAGVLAHEMAHEVQRHPTRGVVRSAGIKTVMGLVGGNMGRSMNAATGALLNLSHSRGDESEADSIGVDMLNKANIRADGLIHFFERMSGRGETNHSPVLTYLSTHPSDTSRVATIRRLARGQGDAMTRKEWQALQSICGVEKAKDDPLSGLFR
jgi:beta-barrel assembly-enhancing protease